MKRTRRIIFAALALSAGIGLVCFEVVQRRGSSSGEFHFWIIVGALLIFLALLELFSKPIDRR
jgi:predicted membrane channel-forming protein YqfA (hemolysin III family)